MTLITIGSILIATLSGLLPIIFLKRWPTLLRLIHSTLIGLAGLGFISAGLLTLSTNQSIILNLTTGFPAISWSLHLDALSGFFLSLIGIIVIAIAFYIPFYLRQYENTKQSINSLMFFTGLFLASMSLVILANNIFSFLFSWEMMSLTSYFLVIYQHQYAENRKAAQVYLLMAHLSGLFILLAFGILAKFSGAYDFQTIHTHAATLTPLWANIAFLFAFLGFGIKSGMVPVHVWLPKAHPVAPSHISALMSGVMLKVAIYGLIRIVFNLLGVIHWQWGMLIMCIGGLSALWGILYALMQNNLKRLLAYSSVENIGIIFIGLGLSVIFISDGHPMLGALSLIAALYHTLNHAVFKSLLFLGAGAILQHTHEHDLENMGGLIHKMPQTALFFLIGCISIAALPPFNGFVSEWLTFQASLQTSVLHSNIMRVVIPIAAAVLALTGALAAACFAKVYGVAFLGKSRTRHARHARKTGLGMRFSMAALASTCLLLGIFPAFIIHLINKIPASLFGTGLSPTHVQHWLWIAPISFKVSSYSSPIICGGIILLCIITYFLLRQFGHSYAYKKNPAWDCGFGGLNTRMQYSATAFVMPIRRVFHNAWQLDEKITTENTEDGDTKIRYELRIKDWIWTTCYKPLDKYIQKSAKLLAHLQGGNMRIYLAYTFFTLLILLLVVS
ncbi:MAG: hydrogenase 4 subunit B [Gammaproteobacteria bacterium]|nr:hydrogenase 4 subunit B [Gammaproteobacteria bacterium]